MTARKDRTKKEWSQSEGVVGFGVPELPERKGGKGQRSDTGARVTERSAKRQS